MSEDFFEASILMEAYRENLPSTSEIVYFFIFLHFRNTQADLHIEYVNFLMRRKSELSISYSRGGISDFPWGVKALGKTFLPRPNIFSADFSHYFFQLLIFIYICLYFLFSRATLRIYYNQIAYIYF